MLATIELSGEQSLKLIKPIHFSMSNETWAIDCILASEIVNN